jgi:hypothetical protein
MPMGKHQNLAQHNDPYKDQPIGHGTGETRNKVAHGGSIHHGVPGHDSHGHSSMREHTSGHHHGHTHQKK